MSWGHLEWRGQSSFENGCVRRSLETRGEPPSFRNRKVSVLFGLFVGLVCMGIGLAPTLSFAQNGGPSTEKFPQNFPKPLQQPSPGPETKSFRSEFPERNSREETSGVTSNAGKRDSSKNGVESRELSERSRKITPRTSEEESDMGVTGSAWFTLLALVLVVGLILVAARFFKRYGPAAIHGLPADAMEVLGKCPLDQRQVVHLVRLGSRILVIGSSPDGLRTLSEVVDSAEVNHLTGLCKQERQEQSIAQTFSRLLGQNDSPEGIHRNEAELSSDFEHRLTHQFSTSSEVGLEEAHG